MKIAVTATGPDLDHQVDPRFGRCSFFQIVDTETMNVEVLENPNMALGGGAGIQSAQLLANYQVEVVLTGNCGPNAFATLNAAGIEVIVGVSGVVRQVVEEFKKGTFSGANEANVASHFGMSPTGQSAGMGNASVAVGMAGGRGMGGGMGRGQGRGMGGGRGMGQGRGMGRGMGMGQGRGMGRGMGMGMGQGQGMGGGMGMAGGPSAVPQQASPSASPLVAAINKKTCTGCGVCMQVCPIGAISMNKVAQVAKNICNGCGLCVAECPQYAISLVKRP